MSPERIAALRLLVAATTPAPWEYSVGRRPGGTVFGPSPAGPDGPCPHVAYAYTADADAAFIAAARTALPEALVALERVRAAAPCAHYFGNGTFCGRAKAHAVHVPFDGDPDRHAFAFPHWLTAALEGPKP